MNRTASALVIALVAGTALGLANGAAAGERADGLNKVSHASNAVPAANAITTSANASAGALTGKARAAQTRTPAFDAVGVPGTQVGYAPTGKHGHRR